MKCLLLRQRTGTRWTLPRLGAKLTVVLRAWLTALLVCSVGWTVCVAATELDLNELGTLKPNGIRHVSVAEAKQLIEADTDVVVLDVRTGREFRHGHIEGAININYFSWSFRDKVAELDKNLTYVVHCKSGVRSGWAAPIGMPRVLRTPPSLILRLAQRPLG